MERISPVYRRISDAGLDLITQFEGAILYAYDDADKKFLKTFVKEGMPIKGTLTIGSGHTRTVKPGMTITEQQRISLLRQDVREAESLVHQHVKVPLSQGEFDAMASLLLNIGPGRKRGTLGPDDEGRDGIVWLGKSGGGRPSTLLFSLNNFNAEKPELCYETAAGCFTQWRQPGSIFELGLIKRRVAEMLRFKGFPWTRAVNAIEALPVTVSRLIDLAREEADDFNALNPPPKPAPEPQPEPSPLPPPKSAADALSDTVETPAVVVPPAVEPAEAGPPSSAGAEPSEIQPPDAPPVIADVADDKPVRAGPEATGAAGKPPSIETSAAPTLPPVVSPPKPPPVILPKTVDVRSIPYGEIEIGNGAKNMTDSKRFVGMLIVGAGSLIQVLAAREVVTSTAGAIFFDLSRDPVVVAIIAGGVIAIIGEIVKRCGTKHITKGMTEARTLLK